MKVIPGPNAGNKGFSFRVNSKVVIECTHDKPAEIKDEPALSMASGYIDGGFLQEIKNPKPKQNPKPSE